VNLFNWGCKKGLQMVLSSFEQKSHIENREKRLWVDFGFQALAFGKIIRNIFQEPRLKYEIPFFI
jgi:hypothetical protein